MFFLFVCFGGCIFVHLMMGTARYDIEYSFLQSGTFLLIQCLCFLGVHRCSQSAKLPAAASDNCHDCRIFSAGVLYLYLTKISTALDMDYSLYKYWVVGLSHSLQINTFGGEFNAHFDYAGSIFVFTDSRFVLLVSKAGFARFGKAVMAA